MNADGWEDDEYARFEATNDLLDYVKSNYEMVTLVKAGKSYQSSKATVNDGKAKSVAAVASEDLKVVRRINTDVSADFQLMQTAMMLLLLKGKSWNHYL